MTIIEIKRSLNHIIIYQQYSFWPRKSTVTIGIVFSTNILLENFGLYAVSYVHVVFTDFRKSFDTIYTIYHGLLLSEFKSSIILEFGYTFTQTVFLKHYTQVLNRFFFLLGN